MRTSKLRIESLDSPPITIPDGQVYIRSSLIQLRFPNASGGLIWNRPAAVVMRTSNGQERIIPILDVTRMAVFTLAGICFTSIFAFMFLKRKKANA